MPSKKLVFDFEVTWKSNEEMNKCLTTCVQQGEIFSFEFMVTFFLQTIQAIALCLSNPRPEGRAGTLVVSPLSTMFQWKEEFETKIKKAGNLNILVYYGSKRVDGNALP